MTNLTVGKLRQAISDLPDDTLVAIGYDGIYRACTVSVWEHGDSQRRSVVLEDAERYPFEDHRQG